MCLELHEINELIPIFFHFILCLFIGDLFNNRAISRNKTEILNWIYMLKYKGYESNDNLLGGF